ncbi:MAG: 2'-5' RNA ligase family protein [Pseudomonadota bacterium]
MANNQPSLFDIDTPEKRNKSLFYALRTNNAGVLQLAHLTEQLREKHRLTGIPLRPEHLHVSLCHLGDHAERPEAFIAMARRAGEAMHMPPFEFLFDEVLSYSGQAANELPFALQASTASIEFKAFQIQLAAEMVKAGLKAWARPTSRPHLTLLYDAKNIASEPVAPLRVVAHELVLVISYLGETRYEIVESWPLTA